MKLPAFGGFFRLETKVIETVITSRKRSIGAWDVNRVLPYSKRRSVGPFVFVDEFGPFELLGNDSMDILSHPHIGLATATYLFEGKMTHRDSLGNVQAIQPGEFNYMTAGSGIVHSERVSDAGNKPGDRFSGLQTWIALPGEHQEVTPSFAHHSGSDLPMLESDGFAVRLLLGSFNGERSRVGTYGSPFYADCTLKPESSLVIPATEEERAALILSGSVSIAAGEFNPGELVVFLPRREVRIGTGGGARFMLLGGPKLENERFMYWNFVSTSRERIETAKDDWKKGHFKLIPNETGTIPLP